MELPDASKADSHTLDSASDPHSVESTTDSHSAVCATDSHDATDSGAESGDRLRLETVLESWRRVRDRQHQTEFRRGLEIPIQVQPAPGRRTTQPDSGSISGRTGGVRLRDSRAFRRRMDLSPRVLGTTARLSTGPGQRRPGIPFSKPPRQTTVQPPGVTIPTGTLQGSGAMQNTWILAALIAVMTAIACSSGEDSATTQVAATAAATTAPAGTRQPAATTPDVTKEALVQELAQLQSEVEVLRAEQDRRRADVHHHFTIHQTTAHRSSPRCCSHPNPNRAGHLRPKPRDTGSYPPDHGVPLLPHHHRGGALPYPMLQEQPLL